MNRYVTHTFGNYKFDFWFYKTDVVSVFLKDQNHGYSYSFTKGKVNWTESQGLPKELKEHINSIVAKDWQEYQARWPEFFIKA